MNGRSVSKRVTLPGSTPLASPSWHRAQGVYEVVVPIRIVSKNETAGGKENGFARSARRAKERAQTRIILGGRRWMYGFPVVVTLSRMAPRLLDDDNPEVKAVRDQVAEWLGVNDGDTDLVKFVTAQEKRGEFGCRIRIEKAGGAVTG